jgi:hypothetical protein
MTQTPRIVYRARDDATPEAEIATLAAVYSFVLRSSQAKKKAGGSDAGESDTRKAKDACTAEENYTRA